MKYVFTRPAGAAAQTSTRDPYAWVAEIIDTEILQQVLSEVWPAIIYPGSWVGNDMKVPLNPVEYIKQEWRE